MKSPFILLTIFLGSLIGFCIGFMLPEPIGIIVSCLSGGVAGYIVGEFLKI